MKYEVIENRELKLLSVLLKINYRNTKMPEDIKSVYDLINQTFLLNDDESFAIMEYARICNMISVPEYIEQNGVKISYLINDPFIFPSIKIREQGNYKMVELLMYAKGWHDNLVEKKKAFELQIELSKGQLESLKISQDISEKNRKIAHSSACAAWAAAISAIISLIVSIISLIYQFFN